MLVCKILLYAIHHKIHLDYVKNIVMLSKNNQEITK